MKKLERRAIICLTLAAVLLAGMILFIVRFVTDGDEWATFYGNQSIYEDGVLKSGTVYDRNGVLLAQNGGGTVTYSDDEEVRRATVHAVGDIDGNISTAALSVFKDKLIGYNLLTGTYKITGKSSDIKLSIDAEVSKTAYEALNGRNGCVAVYNYKTGEIITMVSTPTFDPQYGSPGADAESGLYINKVLSATMTPGSIFKVLTSTAVLENLSDYDSWSYYCGGTRDVNGEKIVCTHAHGQVNFEEALAQSCNCGFSVLSERLGPEILAEYVKKCGLTKSYDINGVMTKKGSFEFPDDADLNLDWAGIGQYNDQINPMSFAVFMGAIANGGKAAEPKMLHSVISVHDMTSRMMEESTTDKLTEMMKNNVVSNYGESNFPGLDIYAKSGTAEVAGRNSTAWFSGFIKNPGYPYAFVVCVENSGYGSEVAAPVANRVLQTAISQ